MSTPRLDINLEAISDNTRLLSGLLAPHGIEVMGVSKACCGLPEVAKAMLSGGARGAGDSRVRNLSRFRDAGISAPLTLIRSPMLSEAEATVRVATSSLNTDPRVLWALSEAAVRFGLTHRIVLMVELGDLREGIMPDEIVDAAMLVEGLLGLTLDGLGTNLTCHSGVVPSQRNMDELSRTVDAVESAVSRPLAVVSGGNSANLEWALHTRADSRITELRLGESILLGTDPLERDVIAGLRTDAFALVGEVIEANTKPAQPWGEIVPAHAGRRVAPLRTGNIRQAVIALGTQDATESGLTPPEGISILGMTSDHLVVELSDASVTVGDEVRFGVNYDALMRASTSPFVTKRMTGEADPGSPSISVR